MWTREKGAGGTERSTSSTVSGASALSLNRQSHSSDMWSAAGVHVDPAKVKAME